MSDRHVGDYGGVTAEFRDTWLAQRAAAMPNRLALRTSGADFTYAELEQRGERSRGAVARRRRD